MLEIISVSKAIYDYISTSINEGVLKPGEKIDERAICLQLKVSRTPVREALAELAGEGYLERTSRRGFRVKMISVEDAKEIYEIIGNLEALAALKALPRLRPKDFEDMEKLLCQMDEAIRNRSVGTFYKLQRKFHDTYVGASGSRTLVKTLESLKNRFMRQAYYRQANEDVLTSDLQHFNNEHRTILDLLKAGKSEELQKYLREVHWDFNHATLESD